MRIAMLLRDYIADTKQRDRLAANIGTSPQYLWQLATSWRGKKPSRLMADAIERHTNGNVSKRELLPPARRASRKRKLA